MKAEIRPSAQGHPVEERTQTLRSQAPREDLGEGKGHAEGRVWACSEAPGQVRWGHGSGPWIEQPGPGRPASPHPI